ncbi:acidic mammalian chitinase [Trichonephila clavipes]|nr:acidic mammalian chitinase [Trichonephila clavipes]
MACATSARVLPPSNLPTTLQASEWVCQFLKAGAKQIFDVSTKVPFAYLGHNWIAYDNEHSVSFKSLWVKDEGYGGIMIFNLNNDDWKGTCDNSTKFPLTRAVTKMTLA